MSWDRDEMREKGFSLDNPAYMAWANLLSATLNIPVDRALKKMENIRDAAHTEAEMWQRIALLGGWQAWEIGFDPDKKKKSTTKDPYNLDLEIDLNNLDLNFDLDINFDNIQLD